MARRSVPIWSNGIFSILVTMLLIWACSWSSCPGIVGMMTGSSPGTNATGGASGKVSSTM
ncbi:Uncharacterised protein [Bordetella pertussis]|nr:Uncharacterised protein [Bordetella pertussis]